MGINKLGTHGRRVTKLTPLRMHPSVVFIAPRRDKRVHTRMHDVIFHALARLPFDVQDQEVCKILVKLDGCTVLWVCICGEVLGVGLSLSCEKLL